MSAGRIAVAITIMVVLMGSVHGYLWARLVRDPGWGSPWDRGLAVALVALAVSIPVTFVAMRALPRALNAPLAWVAYVWMGLLLYLFLFTVTSDLGRVMARVAGALPVDPERRVWLARLIGGGVAAAAGVVGLGGAA